MILSIITVPQNEFHGIWKPNEDVVKMHRDTRVPRNFMAYFMELHRNKKSPFQWHQVSMDFHGLFHGFSCNYGVDIWNETKVRCNSMEHSMEFHGTVGSANQISARHWIPWMSKIPRCHHFKQSHGSMHFLRLFLVLPWEYENQVPSTCVEYFMESWSPRI